MNKIESLANNFGACSAKLKTLPVVSGFDAFVDEMISVVEERSSLTQWTAVPTIARFGELISAAAGKSSLREIVVPRMDAGGCTVNMGDGLATMGIPFHAFATFGEPVHAAFTEFTKKCASFRSWGAMPGRTLAFEFTDGKYMFSSISQLADFTAEHLGKMLADGYYRQCCEQAKLLALTDWSMYPHMTACWQKLNTEVFSKLPHRLPLYLDLVDPSSRAEADIVSMLQTVSSFEKNTDTILGLNGVEANVVARVLGIAKADETEAAISAQAAAIREKLNIMGVTIHCVKIAAMANATGSSAVAGPYCPKPKKSTGAGDRFNAGFCAGTLLQLPPEERLLLGCASSGFFVREARSATAEELTSFIAKWGRNEI